jgi:hypothetical protein
VYSFRLDRGGPMGSVQELVAKLLQALGHREIGCIAREAKTPVGLFQKMPLSSHSLDLIAPFGTRNGDA